MRDHLRQLLTGWAIGVTMLIYAGLLEVAHAHVSTPVACFLEQTM
jgi:hypothetical protein